MIKNFLRNIGYKMSIWMQGRCGLDALGKFLITTALVMSLVSYFPLLRILSLISTVIVVWEIFRFCSKNLYKRSAENMKYFAFRNKFLSFFNTRKKMYQDRNTHKYFKCPSCKQRLRVPKNRGKIEITCPKCSRKFTVKS